MPFLEQLRAGDDLVMGNRFKGGIAPGAMPSLHRYLGNPVLSWLGRLFFRIPIGDFHCGLRGFRTDRMRALGLRTTGMEFASEMVVRTALAGYRITEVPTTLARTAAPARRTCAPGATAGGTCASCCSTARAGCSSIPGLALFAVGLTGCRAALPGRAARRRHRARRPHVRGGLHGRADRRSEHHLCRHRPALRDAARAPATVGALLGLPARPHARAAARRRACAVRASR